MAKIPSGVILIWTGTNGSIPSGYSRKTSLDGKYAKATADATNPNDTGGATTHTHTSPAHYHTLQDHTHTYVLSSAGTTVQGASTNAHETPIDTHTHNGTSGSRSGGSTSSDAVTYGSVSNDPPYYEVIFIESDGSAGVPDDVVCLFSSTTIPSGWHACDGAASSPDLRNKYLKGAAAAGNAGATGGSTTNSHDISHSHTAQAHTHIGVASGGVNESGVGDGNLAAISQNHSHVVSLQDGTQNLNSNTDTLVTTETVEPLYKKLHAIQNQTGGQSKPRGIIGMWLGTLANIPKGWLLCDGSSGTPDMRSYHLKIANDTTEIGNSGGSNTHTHGSQSHSHTSNGTHTHSGTADAHAGTDVHRAEAASTTHRVLPGSVHPVTSVQSVTANYDSATTTADSSNNEPPYRTVAFIMFQRELVGGAAMVGMLN